MPNLTTLVLTNNNIAELGDLEPLKDVKSLQYLSLLGNPVREKKWYREWLAWRIPSLRVLDFQRIRDKVRSITLHLLHEILTRHPFEGEASCKSFVLDRGQSPNTTGDHDLADRLNTLVKTAGHDGRAQACIARQGGTTHVQGGGGQGPGGDRSCNLGGGDQAAGAAVEGRVPARDGVGRCMNLYNVIFLSMFCCCLSPSPRPIRLNLCDNTRIIHSIPKANNER